MRIAGVIVPLITPMNVDGSLDEASLAKLIEHVISGGVSAIFLLGSSGEAPVFSDAEKTHLVRTAVRMVGGRVPILAGVIEASTARAVEQAKALVEAGAQALVPTAPIYFHYSQSEIAAHFRAVAAAVAVPIFVYNIPPLAKMVLTPAVVAELTEVPNILGLKDSDGRLDVFQEFLAVREAAPSFQVWQGAEPVAAISVVRGANGLVLGLANLVPRLTVDLYAAASTGDLPRAWGLQKNLMTLFPIQRHRSFLAGLKTAGHLLGLCGPTVSSPFEPLDAAQVGRVRDTLVGLNLLKAN